MKLKPVVGMDNEDLNPAPGEPDAHVDNDEIDEVEEVAANVDAPSDSESDDHDEEFLAAPPAAPGVANLNMWDVLANDEPDLPHIPPMPMPAPPADLDQLNILIEENVMANPQDVEDEDEEYYDAVRGHSQSRPCSVSRFFLNISFLGRG